MVVHKTMRDFALWTSASGVPHVGRAQSSCMRVFWLVVFLACLGMFSYQMYLLIENYLQFNVIVNTKLEFRTLAFPAVTICNLNPYKKTLVMNATTNNSQIQYMQKLMANYKAAVNGSLPVGDEWGFTTLNDTMAIQARARDHMMYITASMTDDAVRNISYTQDEFIQGCAFNSAQCGKNVWNPRMDPTYGQCFTFNVSTSTTRAGPSYGLRVMLITELAEYLDITESAGVRVTVSGKGERVFPDAFGYNAAAGFTTSFGLQYVETERLDAPYGNCTKQSSQVYSVEGCFRNCLQKYLVRKCDCCDPAFDCIPGKNYCSNKNLTCIQNATGSGSKSAVSSFNAANECNCPELCVEAAYSMTVSTGNWPSRDFTVGYCVDRVNSSMNSSKGISKGMSANDWCAQNTMMVEIFFERMNFQSMSESPAYGTESLLSDFGGQIGLWIGVSVITMVEFLFFPCLLIGACCMKKNGPMPPLSEYDEDDNEFDKIGGALPEEDYPPPYQSPYPMKSSYDPYSRINANFEMPPTVAR